MAGKTYQLLYVAMYHNYVILLAAVNEVMH